MVKIYFSFVWILIVFSIGISGQTNNKTKDIAINNSAKNCRVFLNGKLLNNPKPIYPIGAKINGISGKVEIAVEIDESGNVIGIESTNGSEFLVKAAVEAAKQAKFSPTTCDGKATKNLGIISFNFPPITLTTEFFKPSNIEEFPDVTSEKDYYEAVLFLTENYKIAFGYADQKYHAEMPLTKGDFAHFLCQLLEMLEENAKFSKKYPEDIGLHQSYNPYNLKEIEFNPTAPYADSLKILSDKYEIILANESGSFDGEVLVTQPEVIKMWREIFGQEAVPVNFSDTIEQKMTRGDFAVYLKESLDFLTYKLLPK